ncbi:MAG: 23S rRNA (guanosine(2251)-2'-O)-methyltransferase RlmB [Bacteroidota bacterium]
MAEFILGRRPVQEALKAQRRIDKVIFMHGVKGEMLAQIRTLARQLGVPVAEGSKEQFREFEMRGLTQGVVALVSTTEYVEVEDILRVARGRNEPPFILILDEIEDPHNLGALLRTAECAGAHGVVIPKHHSASVNETVEKTSSGASSHLAVARVTNIARTLDELKQNDVWIVGTDATAEKAYFEMDYSGGVGILVGNEGRGIRRLVKEKCDFLVRIPLHGKIESLNASVAGGLVLYEVARGRDLAKNKLR